MSLAARGSGKKGDVTIAEINLNSSATSLSRIRVGKEGYAYVVDTDGRLVAHPDLALVLRKTDLSPLPQVPGRDCRAGFAQGGGRPDRHRDRHGWPPGTGRTGRDRAAELARLGRDAAQRGLCAALHHPALERRPVAARPRHRRPGEPVPRAHSGRPDPGFAGRRGPDRPGRPAAVASTSGPATSCSRLPSTSTRWQSSSRVSREPRAQG